MTFENVGNVRLASQIFYEGEKLSETLKDILSRFPTTLSSPATFYLDQVNGDDSNLGEENSPWKTLDFAIAKIKESYKSNANITLKLLGNYTLASGLNIDFGDFVGSGTFFIDLNTFNLDLSNGNLNLTDGEGLRFFGIQNGTIASVVNNRRLNISDFRVSFSLFLTNLEVAVAFFNCYQPSVRGAESFFIFPETPIKVSRGGISFVNCQRPAASVIDLENNNTLAFSGSPNALISDIRILENNANNAGSYIFIGDCNFFNLVGEIKFNTSVLRRRILSIQDSSGSIAIDAFVNELGSNIALDLDGDDHFIEIDDSTLDYRDSTSVAPFFTGSGGRGLKINAGSRISWDTSFRSPEELPIINVVNEIESGTELNQKNYVSTVGLFSDSQPDAIDELGKLLFSSQPNRYASGLYPLATVNNSEFSFTAGELFFFDRSDRANPFFIKVNIQAGSYTVQALLSDPLTPNEGVIYACALATGIIEGSINLPTAQELDDRTVFARIAHANDQITGIEPFILENDDLTKELINEGGTRNIGVKIIPADFDPAAFRLQVIGGDIMILGENSVNDPLNPHTIAIAGIQGDETNFLTWDEYDPTGAIIESGADTLDFGRYFDGTTVQTFGGNDGTVKFFYVNKDGQFISVVGRERYGSLNILVQRFAAFETASDFVDYALVAILLGAANGSDSTNTGSLRIINQNA